MMDVKVFKLVTGEEIIGEVIDAFEDGGFTVKHPLGLAVNPEEGRLVFVPYMPYSEATEQITIYATSLLLAPLQPIDSIREDYISTIQRVFQKIVLPQRSLIKPA